MKTHDLKWLATYHEDAYSALPDPYRNDSCLEFWVWPDGVYCQATAADYPVIGISVWHYVSASGEWVAHPTRVNSHWIPSSREP